MSKDKRIEILNDLVNKVLGCLCYVASGWEKKLIDETITQLDQLELTGEELKLAITRFFCLSHGDKVEFGDGRFFKVSKLVKALRKAAEEKRLHHD